MGFCLFNNIAVAAAHLLQKRGLKRVLVVDWDVHHGNGTEDVFFRNKEVFYFSVHQSPLYPGTGPLAAVGGGAGEGYTLNAPMMAGQNDMAYLRVFEDLLVPVARRFKPEFILVSAGFDCHMDDPLGGMNVTEAGFGGMTSVLRDLAEEFCPGRLALTLEGGYNPAAQARSVLAVLDALQDQLPEAHQARRASWEAAPPAIVKRGRDIMDKYWPGLAPHQG
jgi:acetoin utilization deacetylase AcuC-like enzyme